MGINDIYKPITDTPSYRYVNPDKKSTKDRINEAIKTPVPKDSAIITSGGGRNRKNNTTPSPTQQNTNLPPQPTQKTQTVNLQRDSEFLKAQRENIRNAEILRGPPMLVTRKTAGDVNSSLSNINKLISTFRINK